MTYILISFLALMLWWLVFGGRYVIYALSFFPSLIFFVCNNYLYGTVMAFLTFYLIINHLEQEQEDSKGKIYKKAIAGSLFASLPVITRFTATLTEQKESGDGIMIAIVSGVIIAFVAASIVLASGMKRTKGDKNIHE